MWRFYQRSSELDLLSRIMESSILLPVTLRQNTWQHGPLQIHHQRKKLFCHKQSRRNGSYHASVDGKMWHISPTSLSAIRFEGTAIALDICGHFHTRLSHGPPRPDITGLTGDASDATAEERDAAITHGMQGLALWDIEGKTNAPLTIVDYFEETLVAGSVEPHPEERGSNPNRT